MIEKGHGLIVTEFLDTPHGFSTRQGGNSFGIYSSLNFGISTGDNPELVDKNRELFYEYFKSSQAKVATIKQVHGGQVAVIDKPTWFEYEADAMITNKKDLLLIINTADCLPILFYDPIKQVIGAAHAGWRGTVSYIAKNVVRALQDNYGSDTKDVKTVIGPGIAGDCYQVDDKTIQEFIDAGFPDSIYKSDGGGRFYLDNLKANLFALEQAGLLLENIHSLNLCTHCDKDLFYSHRRDGRARGSHWSGIKL